MISEYDLEYEKELRRHVRYHLDEEEHHREKRQEYEARLAKLWNQRGAKRLNAGCPPAFILDCVLMDGTQCPYWHEGECVKAPEEVEA